jgi:hypothetical protein
MSTHQRKIRPIAGPIRKEKKPKPEPKVNYYLAKKATGLAYDYALILPQHRAQVQAAALDIRSRLKRTVEDVIAIGKQLIAVKELLPHGQFGEWLDQEFKMSDRSARNFMYAAEQFGGKTEIISVLDVTTVYLLAAPSTPETARAEVERLLIQGDAPKRAQVKAIIAAHKPKQLTDGRDMEPDEPDAIDADYIVIQTAQVKPQSLTVGEWAAQHLPAMPDDGKVYIPLSRELAQKLCDGVVHRIFRTFFSGEEMDQLLIALTRALEGQDEK